MTPKVLRAATVASVFALSACGVVPPDFNWGDDSSAYANDGDCDDPRFDGPGAYSINLAADVARDASDCRALYNAGRVFLRADFKPGFDYENPDYERQTL